MVKEVILNCLSKNIRGDYYGFTKTEIYENNSDINNLDVNELSEQDELSSITQKDIEVSNRYQDYIKWFSFSVDVGFNFIISLVLGIIALYKLYHFVFT